MLQVLLNAEKLIYKDRGIPKVMVMVPRGSFSQVTSVWETRANISMLLGT